MNSSGADEYSPSTATKKEEMGTTLFGKYKLDKILGYGAFAKVYHARDIKTGQSVAIKVINKTKSLKTGFIPNAVIKREISIMRRLNHPHIVRLFEVLATTTKIYFVMEYAQGGELFSKLTKGRFSEDLSRRYFQQLITAVRFYHSRGVYHRDLKPENLLLDENWNLKVTDFGLSAVKEEIKSDGLLHTLCGTPAYVAPEILSKKGYDGAKADVWSCGVILFVLNAGYLPFNDRNLMNMYRKIYNGEFKCPRWMSSEMKRFLSRVLDPNPVSRITVDEIMNDPWFKIGYNEVKSISEEEFDIHGEDDIPYLNAFNLISFSSGVDISGLLNQPETVSSERFVSAEATEVILARIVEVAEVEKLIVTKKEWGVKLKGENSNFVVALEVHILTKELVVVEVKRRQSIDECCSQKIWKDKIRPELLKLVYLSEGSKKIIC
ncbi:CBL-interacting serine/threonine-protein kinase 14-like [Impatiens glandulifera]|uniref:CBL-interacting serine/threonine-protein kinase 14-like n=1 Tax=Impatiens glandulifera TaxID=253017 RepID=UPI001FB07C2B|nr:CBL-interacting serine/threonine-protein kinase 14-like [Impatiens glandulifera]